MNVHSQGLSPDEAATQPVAVEPSLEQTVASPVTPKPVSPPPSQPPGAVVFDTASAKPPRKGIGKKGLLAILAGVLMILLFIAAGAFLGYRSALEMRQAKSNEMRATVAKEHFMAGLVAQSNKQYEIAKLQFEEVIRQDPTFPGAQDKLREVLMAMSIVNTPTPAPTVALPTPSPTPDTRPQEEIYNQALLQYVSKDWAGLFTSIDSLRRIDPSFHAVEIDGMLYMALRFRGVDKILLEANLEGGLYDLALAERFGPLDVDALGYRNWARLYLNGASFWDADWERVMQYFEEIYPYFPNMRDASGMTASERYRLAARNQGDKLMVDGDPCAAYEFYQKSLNAVNDPEVQTKSEEAYLACYPPTPTVTPTPLVTETPTVGAVTPAGTQEPGTSPTEVATEPPQATEPPPQSAPPLR